MAHRRAARLRAKQERELAASQTDLGFFPVYYRLIDHDRIVGYIALYDNDALDEVTGLCKRAVDSCTHRQLPGPCLRIEPSNFREWAEQHGLMGKEERDTY